MQTVAPPTQVITCERHFSIPITFLVTHKTRMSTGLRFHRDAVYHRQLPTWNGKMTPKAERILNFGIIENPNLLWLAYFHLAKLGLDRHNPVTERLVATARSRLANKEHMTSRRIRKINQAHDYIMNLFQHPRGCGTRAPQLFGGPESGSRKIVGFKTTIETRIIPRATTRQAAAISVSYKRLVAKRQRQVLQLERLKDPILLEAALLCLCILGLDRDVHKLTNQSLGQARRKLTWNLHPDRDPCNLSSCIQIRRQTVHAAHHYILSLFRHQDVMRHAAAL